MQSTYHTLVEIANRKIGVEEKQVEDLAATIRDGYSMKSILGLKRKIEAYIEGKEDLSALEFYRLLEDGSYLSLFHLIERKRIRNRLNNMLQQTYGDHNKLFALGMDMLQENNVEWFLTRKKVGDEITQEEIAQVVNHYKIESKEEEIALWCALTFHDYGKLLGKKYGLDAEDSEFLAEPIVQLINDPIHFQYVKFLIRNHDSIEYVFNGETPVKELLSELNEIDPKLHKDAFKMLGLIQFVGAASLGEGRITKRKADILNNCNLEYLNSNTSTQHRLQRLLCGEVINWDKDLQKEEMTRIIKTADSVPQFQAFLDRVQLRNWDAIVERMEQLDAPTQIKARLVTILQLFSQIWNKSEQKADYFIITNHTCDAMIKKGWEETKLEQVFTTPTILSTTNNKLIYIF